MAVNPNDWDVPIYPSLFKMDIFDWAMEEYERVNSAITGKIAGTAEDAAILAQAVKNAGDGDCLEIGTLFGGSAILAALVKRRFNLRGGITCVDDMLPLFGAERTPKLIISNAEALWVQDYLKIVVSRSSEWKPEGRYALAYIDASHDYENCIADFEAVKDYVDKYIVFHDCDRAHPGVAQAAREAWPIVYLAHHTAVTEKP